MAKGIMAGMTSYDHQSFSDLFKDLKEERDRTIEYLNTTKRNIGNLKNNSYWQNTVPDVFKTFIEFSLKHYETSIEEFNNILEDIKICVEGHHVKRLIRIAKVAYDINADIGRLWHQEYGVKDYNDHNFGLVETIYADTRDMAASLLDISNIASRLDDFVGKKTPSLTSNDIEKSTQDDQIENNNPINGLFKWKNPWFSRVIVVISCAVIATVVGGLILHFLIN